LPKLNKVEVLKKDVQLFGLEGPEELTQAKLKQARDLLMQKHHPDKGGTNEKAQQINRSYKQLSAWIESRDVREQRLAKALRIAMGVLFVVGFGSYIALRRMMHPDQDG